jgi:hypothetical protein
MRNPAEIFHPRRARLGFHTTKTHKRHKPDRIPAAQQGPDFISPNPLCCYFGYGQRMQFDQLKRREC